MVFFSNKNRVLCVLLLLLAIVSSASATDSFFEQDSAKTPFENPPVKIVAAKPAQHFLLPNPMVQALENKDQEPRNESLLSKLLKVEDAHASGNRKEDVLNRKFKQGKLSASDIEQAFGEPEYDRPVSGKQDAPPSYKAIQYALEMGDQQLAFKYAKRYARYLERVKSNVNATTGILGKAMESEGVLAEGQWQSNQKYSKYDNLLQTEKKEQQQSELVDVTSLRDVRKKEKIQPEPIDDYVIEKEKDALTRIKQSGVALSSADKIYLLYFFHSKSPSSKKMLHSVNLIAKKLKNNNRVEVRGIIQDISNADEIQLFIKRNKLEFSIVYSPEYIKTVGVKEYPTSVITVGEGRAGFKEAGVRSYNFLQKSLSYLLGDSK